MLKLITKTTLKEKNTANNNSAQVITFGCRLNKAESQQIENLLQKTKLTKKTIVINSCAVTNEAERQLGQKIRQIHRREPEAQIMITGCAAQTNEEKYKNMKGVVKVIGNDKKLMQKSYYAKNTSIIKNDPTTKLLAPILQKNPQSRFILPIQQGCDHRCTFCIIPYARGKSRSMKISTACDAIKKVVDNGINEVVLSGIDIASWGEDLDKKPKLGDMVQAILHNIPELSQLRLSSIDGAALDQKLKEILQSEKKLMPHIHLSLQAGDNMILKRMRRRHSREQAINLCNELIEKRKNIALGADIIAGFPTEDERMFINTINMIKEARLNFLHIFPFSPRRFTPAARMPQVEREIVRKRANILRSLADKTHSQFLQLQHNSIGEFLIETLCDDNSAIARSIHNVRTRIKPHHKSKHAMKKGALVTAQILPTKMQQDARSLVAQLT